MWCPVASLKIREATFGYGQEIGRIKAGQYNRFTHVLLQRILGRFRDDIGDLWPSQGELVNAPPGLTAKSKFGIDQATRVAPPESAPSA